MRKKDNKMQNGEVRMQNKHTCWQKFLSSFCILHFAFYISLVGCNTTQPTAAPAPPPHPPASLVAANQALAANMPDAAIADAQSYLRSQPNGPQAAEAWYFQGRGYEMKVAADPSGVQSNLTEARTCYLEALQLSPERSLEGDIRASYSKDAFYQDDFADTIQQATAALPLVSSRETKANLLLFIGRSQTAIKSLHGCRSNFPAGGAAVSRQPVCGSRETVRGTEGFLCSVEYIQQ